MEKTVLSILRGIRNGSYYGTKIRAPHGKCLASSTHVSVRFRRFDQPCCNEDVGVDV